MLRPLIALCLLLAAGGAGAADFARAPDPGWVQPLEVPDAGDVRADSDGTRYLLVSDQLELSGRAPTWYRRVSYRIGQERGLADAGRIDIGFQPAYQSLVLHHVDVWRDGVRQDRMDAIATEMLRREEDLDAGIFNGQLSLAITIPDLRVGDRVDYAFSVAGSNPVFGADYYDAYGAAYGTAVGLRQVGARYPAGMPLRWKVGRDGFVVTEGRDGALRTVDIRASNLPAVRVEDRVPDSHDSYGRIEFSTAPDWAAVSRWADGLYRVGFRDRAVAERMVRTLRLHDADKAAVLERAAGFVQGEIRYTALDMGTNSHAPYPPERVLERRFGDCKDKALLLASLLAEAGIRAEPVLVDTDGDDSLRGRLPSAGAFDHVVVRAHLDGREVWIDGTRDREAGPLADRSPLPFGLGLPICRECDALVAIPAPPPRKPQVDVGEYIRLEERDGGFRARFDVVTDYRNERAASVRNDFAYSPEQVGRNYLGYMRGFYEGLTSPSLPRAEDRAQGAGLRTHEAYALDWGRDDGTAFGIVLFQLLDYVPKLPVEPRGAPLALAGPAFARQVARVQWPHGFTIEPEHEEVSTPWFRLVRDVRVVDGRLQVAAEWHRLARVVPAADYPEAQARLAEARELLSFDVDLGAGIGKVFGDAVLWPFLALLLPALVLPSLWSLRRRSRFARMLYAPRAAMPETPGAALRVLRTPRVEFDALLAAVAWGGGPPALVFLLLALVATGGDLRVFDETAAAQHPLAAIVAGLLVLVGSGWALVGVTNAVSVAAGVRRRRVVAAWSLLIAVAALLVGAVVLLLR